VDLALLKDTLMETERRNNPLLREIFEDACTIATPYIDPSKGIGGIAMTRHAYVALHERFPELSSQNLSILVHAVERTVTMRLRDTTP